jgi:hypothetical protein
MTEIDQIEEQSINFRSISEFESHTGTSQTILGNKLENNPWSVAAMTNAFNSLQEENNQLGQQVTQLSPSHYYIKLMPSSLEELQLLYDWDEMLYDFPLDYELESLGDYYIPNGYENNEALRPRYAVVPYGKTIPQVNYNIEEELLLAPTFSFLAWKSYQLLGVDYEDEDALFQTINKSPNDTFTVGEIPWCNPSHPDWPQCLGVAPPPPPEPPVTEGPCDCILSGPRRPSGCIQYHDTQFGNLGLPNVKVIVKDNLFHEAETFTDENGCWVINDFHRGNIWVWVRFKNEKGRVRSLDFENSGLNPIFSYMGSVKDYAGKKKGPSFNNINILYDYSDQDGTNAKRYWYAAHAIKSLAEFHDYCLQDGITTPSDDLDILITNLQGGAAAPMLDDLYETLHGAAYVTSLSSTVPVVTALLGALFGQAAIGGLSGTILSAIINIWSPDIVYNYGNESINNGGIFFSDRVSNTFYHEYAHASNYREILTNEPIRGKYWCDNISHIILNQGYGDGNDPGSDRCAIIESWGFTIGDFYADRRYGSNYSPISTFSWRKRLERKIFWLNNHNYIPLGYVYDLVDSDNSDDFLFGINDQVSDIPLSQSFQNHSQGCSDLNCLRDQVIQNRGSNPLLNMENLLDDYEIQ